MALTLLALAGVGLCSYLTFTSAALVTPLFAGPGLLYFAPGTGQVGDAVRWTMIASLAGVLWSAVSVVLTLYQLRDPFSALLAHLHAVWAGAGTLSVLVLLCVEVFRMAAVCTLCTAMDSVVLLSLLLVLARLRAVAVCG